MRNNDFSEVLKEQLVGLLPPRLNYLSEGEDLVIYALPGGKVEDEDMAGTNSVLSNMKSYKSDPAESERNTLEKVTLELSKIGLRITKLKQFLYILVIEGRNISSCVNDQDYYYLLDLQATIEEHN